MNLEPIHWNVDPAILYLFGDFPLKYYGLLFTSGLLLGYFIVKKIYQKEGKAVEELDTLVVYIFFGTVLGARLGHCLFYEPQYYLHHPLEMLLPIQKIEGTYRFTGYLGLASHGGTLGVLLAIFLFCKKYSTNFLWLLDRVAIAAPVAGAFIRVGNFMNSEIIGKPTGGDYGVVFERADAIVRHPAQLYEAFAYLLIFVLLWLLYHQKPRPNGFLFGVMFFLVFLSRFLIEFFKINQVAFEENLTLNMGQILSLPLLLFGLILLISKFRPIKN